MNEEERLRKRLEVIEKAQEKLKTLRTLASYSTDEKCSEFDKVYKLAREIMEVKMKGEHVKDAEHFCFEMVMELLGKDVWEVYNNI